MTTKYGYELRDWEGAKAEVTAILDERARQGAGPMTYGELAARITAIAVEPHDFAMFHLLGEVSVDEDDLGRGMLSAYVVTAETCMPGGGFFELARKLGRDTDDRLACWVAELKVVDAARRRA